MILFSHNRNGKPHHGFVTGCIVADDETMEPGGFPWDDGMIPFALLLESDGRKLTLGRDEIGAQRRRRSASNCQDDAGSASCLGRLGQGE